MRECAIERACVAIVDNIGGLCYKMYEPKGVPDRLVILPNGFMFFVEFKVPGAKPRPVQEYMHRKLRAKKCKVYVVDSTDKFREVLHEVYATQLPTDSD